VTLADYRETRTVGGEQQIQYYLDYCTLVSKRSGKMSDPSVVRLVQPSTFLGSRFVPKSLSSIEGYLVDLGGADFRYYHTLDCSTHGNARPSDQYAGRRPDGLVREVGPGTIVLTISLASIIIHIGLTFPILLLSSFALDRSNLQVFEIQFS
jgi:hypothetical protein